MTEQIVFKGLGITGAFTPDEVRALIAKSDADFPHLQRSPAMSAPAPVRKTAHVQKPLSPKAARFVADIFAETVARQRAIEKAVAAAGSAPTARPVAKAKTDPPVAIYDANGNLVGTCAADSITMIADAKAPDAPDSPPADLTPAPAASVGTPADVTAKAMSARVRNGHQLGGDNPAGGLPVVPAEDVEEELAKARVQVLSANLKKSLNGGINCSAEEANRVANAMNTAALAKFQEMRQRGQVGAPRRP